MDYVRYLADDTLEGRAMNTPGGTTAGQYLAQAMKQLGMAPGGPNGEYIQDCGAGCRNVLGILPGSDPALAAESVVVGAHYDHIGVRRSRGAGENASVPSVCNGANDNASGVAGVLEIAEAMTRLPQPPRRSILFALWDGEERGFVGSQYFVAHPTVALDRITCVLAIDMIGRVADNRLVVWGTGTAIGFRELFTAHNAEPQLDIEFRPFTLPLSDHQPFFVRGIPSILPSSGLFPELHRPTDDVALINADGLRRATQLLQGVVYDLANRDDRLAFVEAARTDTERNPARSAAPPTPQPDDISHPLGFTYQRHPAEPSAWIVVQVTEGTPAAEAGLLPADRIRALAGVPVSTALPPTPTDGQQTAATDLQIERNGRMMSMSIVPK
jgi:hypothetical protein